MLAAAVLGAPGPAAAAACAAPELTVSPRRGRAGSAVAVRGRGFWDSCRDTIVPGQTHEPMRPQRDVEIRFTQQGRTIVLGTVDATGSEASFQRSFRVPDDATPGDAVFEAKGGLASPEPATDDYEVLPSPTPTATQPPSPTPEPTASPTPEPTPSPSPVPSPSPSPSGARAGGANAGLVAGVALAGALAGLGGTLAYTQLRRRRA